MSCCCCTVDNCEVGCFIPPQPQRHATHLDDHLEDHVHPLTRGGGSVEVHGTVDG